MTVYLNTVFNWTRDESHYFSTKSIHSTHELLQTLLVSHCGQYEVYDQNNQPYMRLGLVVY